MRPSLFDFAGGEPAFLALATAHHARCVADPELSHPFSHPDQHPQHVERLAAYWAEVLGGAPTYSQSCGTQAALAEMHCVDEDLSDLGRRFIGCFVAAMDDVNLPDDPQFRAAMRGYMVWAVERFTRYPRTEPAGSDDVVPHWSWDGLQPAG
jgi:hemoglobin